MADIYGSTHNTCGNCKHWAKYRGLAWGMCRLAIEEGVKASEARTFGWENAGAEQELGMPYLTPWTTDLTSCSRNAPRG